MNSKDRDRAPMGDPGADGTAPEPPATPSPPARPPRRTLAVGAVMVLCGVLLSTTARLAGGGSIRDDSGDVAGALRERGQDIDELTRDAEAKRAEIEQLTSRSTSESTARSTERLTEAVGLSAVSGPALRVTLSDAPSSALTTLDGVRPDDLVVHQQDMESYINALWAGGAEAMMLQDQRVVAGSAFRCAGNTLILEGRVHSPPFVITAIGPTAAMTAALEDSPGVQVYRDWVDYVGLGESVETVSETTLPAFTGNLTLEIASAR